MADLSITAASVVPGSDAKTVQGIAGETITQGMAVTKLSTTGKWMKADADHATAELQVAQGIALTGSSLNQPIVVQKSGEITIGATVTPGLGYFLSGLAAGGICLVADVGSGEEVCQIGLATSATEIAIDIQAPGVQN